MGLGGEIIDFVGLDAAEDFPQAEAVSKISMLNLNKISEFPQTILYGLAASAQEAVDLVSFAMQKLGEVVAVLPSNARNESLFGHERMRPDWNEGR